MPVAPSVVPTPIMMRRSTRRELQNDRVPRWGSPLPAALCCVDYQTREWQGCCTSQCILTCLNGFDPFESLSHTAAYISEHPQNDARVASFLGTIIATLGRGAAGALMRRGLYTELVDPERFPESELMSYIYGSWCLPCSSIQAASTSIHVYRSRNRRERKGELGCCSVDGMSHGPLQEWYYVLQIQRVPCWRCCQCCCCPTARFE